MTTRSNQRRAERALADLRRRLEGLNAEEVRLMLDRRRVRSPERVAMAQARLAELERAERARPQKARPATADGGQQAARAIRPNGQNQADEERPAAEPAGIGSAALRLPGQVARMLGVGLGLASVAALALLFRRR